MSIKHAMLGLLSWQSFTGYDLKKIIADSEAFYWSGNSNQIYKMLIPLHKEELVTSEVQHQDNAPSKKIYKITEKGKKELKQWIMSIPEPPALKNTFLIQLAWADQLNKDELNDLLEKYEEEVHLQLLMHQEKASRANNFPDRTNREKYLWKSIHENIIHTYENELGWVKKLKKELATGIYSGDK
ncbi:MAG: PadR family transcriptional regulator [Actinobacteria bacterium]|nr:PadR family transcriptional regulator [Actinomycetota bacterium]